MVTLVLHCPYCDGVDIVRHGTSPQGKQRYRCRTKPCKGRTFLLDYAYQGQSQHMKDQMVDMALNGSGIRDTARVLHVSTRTVLKELRKKEPGLQQVNHAVLASLQPEQVEVEICRAEELEIRCGRSAELDELWSFVGKKAQPRWLWHAIDGFDHGVGHSLLLLYYAKASNCQKRVVSLNFRDEVLSAEYHTIQASQGTTVP